MYDSVNDTRLPKEFLLPDWARRDKQGTMGDRVDVPGVTKLQQWGHSPKKIIPKCFTHQKKPKWHKTHREYSEAQRSQVAAVDVFLPVHYIPSANS